MVEWDRGCVQVYTGDGKGKTTAALGLMLRAVGAGLKVYMGQFIKGRDCAELAGIELLGESVTLERFGSGRWVNKDNSEQYEQETELTRLGLRAVRKAIHSGEYAVVIMDEVLGALKCGLLSIDDLLDIIDKKPKMIELVITGRNAPAQLIEKADLASEIIPLKHYYHSGVAARKGIEF